MAKYLIARRSFSLIAALAFLAAMEAMCMQAFAEDPICRMTIVKSWDLPEYNKALEGFDEEMERRGIRCETQTFNIMGRVEDLNDVISEIREFEPKLILTVGTRATGVMSKHFGDVPIVFAMVLYPVASDFVESMKSPGKNVTGAAVDVPIRRQLQQFSTIVPNLKRVGVLYSPEETLPVIEQAKRVASSLGIELMAEKIQSESDVPEALKRLEKLKIDALWSVADGKVFTRPSTKYIIEQMMRSGTPFMGPHNGFVKAGALVALTADYEDNGRQAAEIALRILSGVKPENVPVATARRVEMALNLRVANHIRLRIAQSIIDEASQVFE